MTFTGGAGTSATVSGIGVMPPNIALNYNGKLRDRVGKSETALTADGFLDGTFTVTLQAGSGNRTVTSLDLRRSANTGIWDTIPNNTYWISGAAISLDAALLNASNGTVNFAVADGAIISLPPIPRIICSLRDRALPLTLASPTGAARQQMWLCLSYEHWNLKD